MTVPRCLTPKEVARVLGVSYSTLKVWRRLRVGPPGFRLGGPKSRVVYLQNELNEWIRSRPRTNGRGN